MNLFSDTIGRLAWVQLWQVTLAAVAIGLTTRLFCRNRPHLAYVLWIVVLIKSLTPPIWTSPTGVFSWSAAVFAPITTLDNNVDGHGGPDERALAYGPSPGEKRGDEVLGNTDSAPAAATYDTERGRPPVATGIAHPPSGFTTTLGVTWLIGALVCAALILISTVRLRRTIFRSRTIVDPALANLNETLCDSLRVRRPVRLVVVPEFLGPLAFGWVRPTVVLPQALVISRSREELEPLVAHELVHVRRNDALVALFQTVVQCLWWFHPLMWWANRRIVEERERCCDEAVITGLGWQPGRYARSLLAVLEWKWQARWLASVPGIRAFEINQRRLAHLLQHPGRFRDAMSGRDWLFLVAGLLLLIPGAAPTQSADAPLISTRKANPTADRHGSAPAVEASNQLAATPSATDDDVAQTDSVVETNEAPKGLQIEIYAMNVDGTNARKVATVPDFPIINSPEISPDGKWIAVDGWKHDQNLQDAHLLLVNLESGRVKDLGLGAMPTWSSDGKWIAYSKYQPGGGVFLREVDGEGERLIDRNGWGIQWSPDGFKAAYTRGGNIVVYDFIADLYKEVFPANDQPYTHIYWNCKWSPDSRRICFKGDRHDKGIDISIVTVTGNDPKLRVVCEGQDYNEDIGWHPDGSRVTLPRRPMPGQPGQIYEFNPDSDKPPLLLAGQPADRHNAGMCFSRDGKTFYFVSYK